MRDLEPANRNTAGLAQLSAVRVLRVIVCNSKWLAYGAFLTPIATVGLLCVGAAAVERPSKPTTVR